MRSCCAGLSIVGKAVGVSLHETDTDFRTMYSKEALHFSCHHKFSSGASEADRKINHAEPGVRCVLWYESCVMCTQQSFRSQNFLSSTNSTLLLVAVCVFCLRGLGCLWHSCSPHLPGLSSFLIRTRFPRIFEDMQIHQLLDIGQTTCI